MEDEYWRTKSRTLWLQAGDRNTKYFPSRIKKRRAHNCITSLVDSSCKICSKQEEITKIIYDYFTNLFYSQCDTIPVGYLQQIHPRVTDEMNRSFTKPVTEEEVFQALQQMNADKAPRPDVLTAGFYKDHWSMIKSGVVSYIQNFLDNDELDHKLNHTHICLVPKVESPTDVKDYIPINLTNVAYKILSKVLAERLKPLLHHLISENQTAFIPGRLITDNVFIAHKMVHSMHTRTLKTPYMALKLYITKVFDKVEWSFIEEIMKRMGFAEKWCH